MGQNPLTDGFGLRFVVGVGVLAVIAVLGQAIGMSLVETEFPYGQWVGVSIGVVAAFVIFTAFYRQYDATKNTE